MAGVDFSHLEIELAKWANMERTARVWWRDDDAQAPSTQLDRLLEISTRHAQPLAIAVVPDGTKNALAARLEGLSEVRVVQHGYSHRNHAPANERKMELGAHRPQQEILAELGLGFSSLEALFAKRFIPVLVPPWNRIDAELLPMLPDIGLRGLSTLSPRDSAEAAAGLLQVNVHVDIINWRNGRQFVGVSACLQQLIAHLRAKRKGLVDKGEPTGIMSHHLVHDAGCWDFLEQLLGFLRDREEVQMLSIEEILNESEV